MWQRSNLAWSVLISTLLVAGPLVLAAAEPLTEQLERASTLVESHPPAAKPPDPKPLWPRTYEFAPEYTLRLRGRIDADAIWVEQSAANEAAFGDIADVVGLRRAWVGIDGEWGGDRRYQLEIDLASGTPEPRDVFVAKGVRKDDGEYRLGHFREPFSLEGGTSARFIPFMERSAINMLDPGRSWGTGYFREFENSTLAIGAFHDGTGPANIETGPGSTFDFTGRWTMCPINEGEGRDLLHVGVSLSEMVPEDGTIVIKKRPQSSLLEFGDSSSSVFVSRVVLDATFQQVANLQLLRASGPFWAQAEWYGTWIDQTTAGTVYYNGCYVAAGYFLTGEHRRYDSGNGTLGAIRVNRPWLRGAVAENRPYGYGAWEVAARFAYLDFVDADTPLTANGQPQGVRLPQMTYGVNWYLSDRVRLMFNYQYDMPDEINTGTSTANTFSTRLAVFW